MATKVTIEVKGFDQIAQNFGRADLIIRGAMNRMLRRIGQTLTPGLKSVTPVLTGKLKNSTRFQIKGAPDSQVMEIRQGAKTPGGAFYGEFVREGTSPHIIRPKKAKALVFKIGEKVIFARQVNHPGTRPNRYQLKALRAGQSKIDAIVAEETEKVAADLTR